MYSRQKILKQLLTCTICQIPSATSTAVNPTRIKILSAEKFPRSSRIDACIISVQNPTPAASDLGCRVECSVGKVSIPLLGYESGVASVGARRREGKHVNAFNILWVRAKVGCMINLVLKQLDLSLAPGRARGS